MANNIAEHRAAEMVRNLDAVLATSTPKRRGPRMDDRDSISPEEQERRNRKYQQERQEKLEAEARGILAVDAMGGHYFGVGALAVGTAVVAAASVVSAPVVVGVTIGALVLGTLATATAAGNEVEAGACVLMVGTMATGFMAVVNQLSPALAATMVVGALAVGTLKAFKATEERENERRQDVAWAKGVLADRPTQLDVASWQALRAKGAHSDQSQVGPPRIAPAA